MALFAKHILRRLVPHSQRLCLETRMLQNPAMHPRCMVTGGVATPGRGDAPNPSGTVFTTAGSAAAASDPGASAAAAAPGSAATAAPAGKPGAARLQPAAGVSPAAAAEAATEVAQTGRTKADAVPEAGAAAGAVGAAHGGSNAGSASNAGKHSAEQLSEEQRDVLATIIREALASEAAAEQLVCAQRAVMGSGRPDLAAAAQDQAVAADTLRALAPQLRARPSALGPLWGVAGAAAGAAAGLAPRGFADAIRGGAAEAFAERYTGHLRQLAAAGAGGSPAADALRSALRTLRDMPRRPDGAKPVPDIISMAMNQQLPPDMTPADAVGGVTKALFQGMFAVASHV